MSGLFRPPHAFAKHDDFETIGTSSTNKVTREAAHEHRGNPGNCRTSSVLLRDDHLILFVIDLVLAVHTRWKRWRKHRRTLRALADLDERQLRDIGVTRDNDLSDIPFYLMGKHKSYRALAGLDETQLSNLSEHGLRVRREIRRGEHDRTKK